MKCIRCDKLIRGSSYTGAEGAGTFCECNEPLKPPIGPAGVGVHTPDRKVKQTKMKMARGVRGYLMRSFDKDGKPAHVFRVYDNDHNFIDYDILHYDMEIVILEDAMMYEDTEGNHYIDYEPFDDVTKYEDLQ